MTPNLTDLSIEISKPEIDQAHKLVYITRFLSEVIPSANRITLWQFTRDKSAIECLYSLQDGENPVAKGTVLCAKDYPRYFEVIVGDEVFMASDARHHEVTEAFTRDYFEPNNIYSLLDYMFHSNFVPIGIICCESVGKQTDWSDKDVEWLRRTAGVVSMFY